MRKLIRTACVGGPTVLLLTHLAGCDHTRRWAGLNQGSSGEAQETCAQPAYGRRDCSQVNHGPPQVPHPVESPQVRARGHTLGRRSSSHGSTFATETRRKLQPDACERSDDAGSSL